MTVAQHLTSLQHMIFLFFFSLSLLSEEIQFSFFSFSFFLFIERGRRGEREGEKHQCVVASHVPTTGDLACDPGMCSDWDLNQEPFGSQADTQSTEPHQPGLNFLLK